MASVGFAGVNAANLHLAAEKAGEVVRWRSAEDKDQAILAFIVEQKSESAPTGLTRKHAARSFNPLPMVIGELRQCEPFGSWDWLLAEKREMEIGKCVIAEGGPGDFDGLAAVESVG